MSKKTYLTTPIYYVNSVPHVGHALTMLACDIEKRYRMMQGEEVVFLTGTDDNGLKVMEAAQAAGEPIKQFVDRISKAFSDCADLLNIQYDVFYQTSTPEHHRAVQNLFEKIKANGYIYTDRYEGWYDVSDEAFVRESDLVDGKSPSGNEVRWVSEENYFFKLSAFGDQLLAHADANPEFWMPEGRRAEVVSFIKSGLRDLCITRANPGWGIPVPGDDTKVIYVWFDALINYLAASGWPEAGWEAMWPADVHWMAKEIFTRFHATTWPAMLMAAGLPLPKTIIAHGWFTFNDAKMSKSKGNVLAPTEIIDFFVQNGCTRENAIDVVRFSLARMFPYGNDTNYTLDEICRYYNADLANDVGNALNRTINMLQKFSEGKIPNGTVMSAVIEVVQDAIKTHDAAIGAHKIDEAVGAALEVVRYLNRFIQDQQPWQLHKENDARLPDVLVSMAYCLRATEGLLRPYIPHVCDQLLVQLGYSPKDLTTDWSSIADTTRLNFGAAVTDPQPLFPRLDLKLLAAQNEAKSPPKAEKPAPKTMEIPTEIDITDFMKVNLRVARILEAEAVENSEKLVKLQVLVGTEKRQILAGIRKSYEPGELVGRQIIVITNLKPRKLAGLESQGMVLAADGPDGTAILLQPDSEAPEGTSVH